MAVTRILDTAALRAIVDEVGLDSLMDEMIERLRTGFRRFDPEQVTAIDRTGFWYEKPALGLVEWMPTMEAGGRVSIKTVGYHPTNPTQRGLPSVMATTSLHDTTTGRLVSLTDATFLTALRTGAASGVATDLLAPIDATVLGVVGAGAQAITQVHAVSRVRPIERVVVYDADPEIAATFVARLPLDVAVVTADAEGLDHLVENVEILCTCTSVEPHAGPVFVDRPHIPGLHINAVGADFPGKTEVPTSMMVQAFVVPDSARQCLAEGEAQVLRPDQLGPELWELVAAGDASHRQELTVFDSTGWALEDLIAAELALDHADRLGVGVDAELQAVPVDPYDPYEVVRPR
ncbi:MAG: ornithine cyclodeaminase family protein [Ilumatobacter sp.]|uniref:ornithine cyclodeaminase family protein n=1 Tax=Ilumatobacter sp. TaxID=1967498 RepID=UPI00260AAA2A|nr:ornithine cyclodeaminase family protein [Ilumatobacter sp.]MDJ0769336.1 ornithine cyclodeaminase family protein [Ilumatobacter sp.]